MSRRAVPTSTLIVVVLGLLGLAPASAAVPDAVCAQVTALTDAARPQSALTLLETLRADDEQATACGQERVAALERVGAAEELAARAAASLADGDTEAAAGSAREALAQDADNQTAADTLDAATPTLVQDLKNRWDAFWDDHLSPGSDLAVTLLVTLAVALVAARLLTFVVPPAGSWSTTASAWQQAVGVVLALAAGLVLTVAVPRELGWSILGLVLLGAAIHVLHEAWAGALRLRVDVSKGGSLSQEESGHVIGLLQELGGERPRGLEVPQGTDTTALASAGLSALPQNALAAAAFRVFELLVPRSPWHVRVDVESDDVLTVAVRRNGRLVESAVVDRDELGLRVPASEPPAEPPTQPDLHRAAAAVVLTALERPQRAFAGLHGATNWRSLALHAVATTELRHSDLRDEVLARALRHQPENLLAQVAFHYYRERETTDPKDLQRYVAWLAEVLTALPEPGSALRLRVLLSRAAATINLWYACPNPDPERSDAQHAAAVLVEELVAVGKDPEAAAYELAREMQPSAGAMYLWAYPDGGGRTTEATAWAKRTTLSPQGHYNLACLYATGPEADVDLAVHHLRLASVVPKYDEWRTEDPQLEALRAHSTYRAAFLPNRDEDFLTLEPIAAHRSKLRDLGVHDATTLSAAVRARPGGLATYLGVERGVVERIGALADLGARLQPCAGAWTRELCAELLARDLGRPAATWPACIATEVSQALARRLSTSPSDRDVREWLRCAALPPHGPSGGDRRWLPVPLPT